MTVIALAGNPNSGKTTLFNALTGSRQRVGNWPGVTVEKKEGTLKGHKDVTIQDLPGIYSLSPYTLEEVVSRSYLVSQRPDVILNILDGTNLERNLYLTLQLLQLDIPVVVAVNMADMIRANGDTIDLDKLSKRLGCPVVSLSAARNEGIDKVVEAALKAVSKKPQPSIDLFDKDVKAALNHIENQIPLPERGRLWYAVKLFEGDTRVMEDLKMTDAQKEQLEAIIDPVEKKLDDDRESIITDQCYTAIARLLSGCFTKKARSSDLSFSDKIDRIVTNRILALPIFILIMFGIYSIAMGSTAVSIGTMGTDWANDVLFGDWVPNGIASLMEAMHVGPVLSGLILDGIVAGVGATLGFVPQILVLFFFLAILEDCGYMARVAFIMDRLFRRFGLSGKSFIPLLVATGCGVPGIMASRTIEQDRDRKMTIITTGFIPCGAKMPVIGLFAGAVFGGSALVAVSAFVIGIGAVIITGIMLKKFRAFAGEPAPFVMELPAYHMPSLSSVLHSAWERGWSFIKRAGTLILASSIVLWFLQAFGWQDGVFGLVDDNNYSILAAMGRSLAWIFYPLGWVGDMAWKSTVATFTGLIAKEEVVNTFGVLYNVEGNALWDLVGADFTPLAAYSFMIFNLLCAPCFAAMGAIKREMNDRRWTVFAIGYMCLFAYVVSLIVYQLGGLFSGEASFSFWTIAAIGCLGAIIYLLCRKGYDGTSDVISTGEIALEKR